MNLERLGIGHVGGLTKLSQSLPTHVGVIVHVVRVSTLDEDELLHERKHGFWSHVFVLQSLELNERSSLGQSWIDPRVFLVQSGEDDLGSGDRAGRTPVGCLPVDDDVHEVLGRAVVHTSGTHAITEDFPRAGSLHSFDLRSPTIHFREHVPVSRDEHVDRRTLDLPKINLWSTAVDAPVVGFQVPKTPLHIGHRSCGRPLLGERGFAVFRLYDVDRLDSLGGLPVSVFSVKHLLELPRVVGLPGLAYLFEVGLGLAGLELVDVREQFAHALALALGASRLESMPHDEPGLLLSKPCL